jgi:hypothetical protein
VQLLLLLLLLLLLSWGVPYVCAVVWVWRLRVQEALTLILCLVGGQRVCSCVTS